MDFAEGKALRVTGGLQLEVRLKKFLALNVPIL